MARCPLGDANLVVWPGSMEFPQRVAATRPAASYRLRVESGRAYKKHRLDNSWIGTVGSLLAQDAYKARGFAGCQRI
jgi:hypothetical protein